MPRTLAEQLKPIAAKMAEDKLHVLRQHAAQARNQRNFRRANELDRVALKWSQLTVQGENR